MSSESGQFGTPGKSGKFGTSGRREATPAPAGQVAAPPSAEPAVGDDVLGGPSPAGRAEFTDDAGRRWRKVRGPLHPRLGRRLAARADAFVIGEGAGERFRHVASGDRLPAWRAIEDRLDSPLTPSYRAFEFRSAEGMTLLYVEESC
ncbi:hypothetical protein [Streptomyces sp. JB150]|uniref:hypothetical protein n=1 Tax=Streptomyces sp. JB150 TaxID=2714844 RepID=UPI0014079D6E|nr:hypothetical protein [Streptomyces sp. JB150]QIJ63756.1 hypothetical protein G7Z13_18315 [Streptomyces sp. JB150]